MPRTKADDPQPSFFDRTVEDPELEAALEAIWDAQEDEDFQVKRKALADARKKAEASLKFHVIADNERLRCGRFIVEGKARAGGGFAVPTWEKVIAGPVREIPS